MLNLLKSKDDKGNSGKEESVWQVFLPYQKF